jgi:3-oxoacyl-[acyl-carrier-protein] synthase II
MSGAFVVTGTGLVSAAGDTRALLLRALVAGVPLAAVRPEDQLAVAAVEAFDPKRYILRKGVKDLSRTSQLACSAAAESARGLEGVPADDVGVVFGSAWGSLKTVIEFEREAHLQGPRFVDPILFTETVSNVPAGQLAIHYGWSAFNATVSTGAASGLTALRQALAFLEEGRAPVAVAGGGDELNAPVLRVLRRDGLVAGAPGLVGGEGACFLTIERDDHAASRGAAPLAVVEGSAGAFVPGDAAGRRGAPASMARVIRETLAAARLERPDVDVVLLSARGFAGGDAEEAHAVLDVFGGAGEAVPVVAPKAILGETWGASGALGAAVAIEMMGQSIVPAAPRGFSPSPELRELNVPRETLHRPVRNALILDRTDSGHQIGLVLSRKGAV